MSRATREPLSEAELEVLKALWDEGPAPVRRINEVLGRRGRSWAYTTVLTLLQRLAAKGWVAVDATGPAHIFRASATREEWLRDRLHDLADRVCEGTTAPLVLALVQGHRFTAEEIARFRQLLDRQDKAGGADR